LNPEWWGSSLVQEKYQIVKACDKRQQQHNNIPVTVGATGTITESIRQYWNNLPEKHEIKEL